MARPKIVPSIKWSTDWHKRWKYANLYLFVVFLYFQDFGKEQEEENILIFTGGPPDVTLCFFVFFFALFCFCFSIFCQPCQIIGQ